MDTTQPAAAPRPRRRFARPVPVTVNGVAIPSAAIARETQHHQASDPDVAWELAARALAIRELLMQEAARLAIEAEPIDDGEGRMETAEEARLRPLLEREVVVPRADETTCRRYYDSNRRRFRSPDLFEAAHILFAAAPGDEAARAAARQAATGVDHHASSRGRESFGARLPAASAASRPSTAKISVNRPGQKSPDLELFASLIPGSARSRWTRATASMSGSTAASTATLPFELPRDRIAE